MVFPTATFISPAEMLSYAELLAEVSCEVLKRGIAQVLGCPAMFYMGLSSSQDYGKV